MQPIPGMIQMNTLSKTPVARYEPSRLAKQPGFAAAADPIRRGALALGFETDCSSLAI